MKTAACALLLAVACLATCAGARPVGLSTDVIDALKEWGTDHLDISSWGGSFSAAYGDEEEKFILLLRFDVAPSNTDDFAEAYGKIKGDLEKCEGALRVHVTSNLLDNVQIFAYQEWRNQEAFVKFMQESGACKQLGSFIKDRDVRVRATQLLPIATHRAGARSDVSSLWGEHKPRILMKICHKPSLTEEFNDAAGRLVDLVREKEGDKALWVIFKRNAFLPSEVIVYGSWQDEQALQEHLSSAHVQDFMSYVMDKDIVVEKTVLTPILQVEKEEKA